MSKIINISISFVRNQVDKLLPQLLQRLPRTVELLAAPLLPQLVVQLHVLALLVFQGVTHNVLGFTDFQLSCALNGHQTDLGSLQEDRVSAVQPEFEVKVAILVVLLLDLTHKLQHLGLQLLVQQQSAGSSGGIEQSDRPVRWYLARYVEHSFVRWPVVYDPIGPQVRFAGADEQEVLEYFCELGLLDPVYFVLLFDLQHILIVLCDLHPAHCEQSLTPLAVFVGQCFEHMALLEAEFQLIEHSFFGAFESHHAHSTHQSEHILQREWEIEQLCCLDRDIAQQSPVVCIFVLEEECPLALTIQPNTHLPILILEWLKHPLNYPTVDRQQYVHSLVDDLHSHLRHISDVVQQLMAANRGEVGLVVVVELVGHLVEKGKDGCASVVGGVFVDGFVLGDVGSEIGIVAEFGQFFEVVLEEVFCPVVLLPVAGRNVPHSVLLLLLIVSLILMSSLLGWIAGCALYLWHSQIYTHFLLTVLLLSLLFCILWLTVLTLWLSHLFIVVYMFCGPLELLLHFVQNRLAYLVLGWHLLCGNQQLFKVVLPFADDWHDG